MLVLAITLFVSVGLAFIKIPANNLYFFPHTFSLKNPLHLAFLIAFAGWMPAPLDISVWQSLWAEAKNRQLKRKTTWKEALLDFNTGYIATIITALGFLSLGALIMHGNGQHFPAGSISFAGKLIELFTLNIGSWAFYFIALAAFATMYSTTLTCFDAYTRVMTETTPDIIPVRKISNNKTGLAWAFILLAGTMIILVFLARNMKQMVDFATTLSFVLAPVIAFLNYLVINGKEMPESGKPGKVMKIYALFSLAALTGFSLFYIIWKFFL
jgi:Mn2+/Fe2+ NRAMP family transporter